MPKSYNQQGRSLHISQNFLTSKKTIKRLLKLTNINKHDHVIEIGAGKGHITKELTQRSRKVTAIEIDNRLFLLLKTKIGNIPNLKLFNIDFLKMRLPTDESYKVFSNIPFSITTDIMHKLMEAYNPPSETWLIMEKGAAKRFSGKPNETLNSLRLKPFFNLKVLYYFRKDDFHPIPAVDIVLLHIKQKHIPDLPFSEYRQFNNFITHAYKYGLKSLLTKKQIATALRRSGLPQIEYSGTMLYVQWLCLFRCWMQFQRAKGG